MQVQIDQSGKIENTSKNTVLAFANSKSFSVLITAKCKRQLQDIFRRRGQSRIFIYWTFAAGIALLLQDCVKEITEVIIDEEYTDKDRLIREILIDTLQKLDVNKIPEIFFDRIGKKSKAHYIAYGVNLKRIKVGRILSLKVFKELYSVESNKDLSA